LVNKTKAKFSVSTNMPLAQGIYLHQSTDDNCEVSTYSDSQHIHIISI